MRNQILIIVLMALIARAEGEVGSLRGVHKKVTVPQPFCLFRGVAKPRLFSFKSQLAASRNLWQPAENPCQRIWQPANPKAPARAAKLRRRGAIALNFNFFFLIAITSELHLGFYFKLRQLESFV